ncbi:MAG: hypothetical protein IJ908_09500 [Fibrobacter sp.]|nr:hypothetical protein [Fibrobacter sp.]
MCCSAVLLPHCTSRIARKGLAHSASGTEETQTVGQIRSRVADSPDDVLCLGCYCAERASPFPTTVWVRIRLGLVCIVGVTARNAGDGVPYRAAANLPKVCGNLAAAAGASGTPPPTEKCCGFAGRGDASSAAAVGVPYKIMLRNVGEDVPYGGRSAQRRKIPLIYFR